MSDLNTRYKLIEDCYLDVVRYLRRFNLSKADLEDAIQDTMTDAFSYARDIRDESKVRHWIIKIAKTNGLRYKRKRNIFKTKECELKEDVLQLECANPTENDALKEIFRETDNACLYEALGSLKQKERDVLILQHVYKQKQKDIAKIIGESLTNTKTISHRAREKVRQKLIEGGYFDEKYR